MAGGARGSCSERDSRRAEVATPPGQLSCMLADAPRFSTDDAERFARDHFAVDGRATELTSERDQNFLIATADRRIVLKIANASEDRAMLAAQHAALAHLSARLTTTPALVPAVDGSSLVAVT